jgi:hypothetical protein
VLVWGWVLLGILGYIAFFSLVLNLLGYLSGWWALARVYRLHGHFEGTRRPFRRVSVGGIRYNGSITVGTNSEGLYLAMFSLFRSGHPPLFIPWSDVSAKVVKGWFWTRYLELQFAHVHGVRVRLPEKLGREIAADANQAWGSSEIVRQGAFAGDRNQEPGDRPSDS